MTENKNIIDQALDALIWATGHPDFNNKNAPIVHEAIEAIQRKKLSDEIPWFTNDVMDDGGLEEFIFHTKYSWFRKGGRDRTGKYLIFLMDSDKTLAAIRSNSQKLHCRALQILQNGETP